LSEQQQKLSPEIDEGFSKVAISRGSSMLIMVAFGLIMAYVVYQMLQPSEEELAMKTKSEIDANKPIAKPTQDIGQNIVVPEIPRLPDVPVLSAPVPPPAPTPAPPPVMDINIPTPPPVIAPIATPTTTMPSIGAAPSVNIVGLNNPPTPTPEEVAAAARKKAKITSSIMLRSGTSNPASKNLNSEGKALDVLTRNSDQIVATYIGDQQRIIAQGKVIDAVLETAINTDLPGSLRAIISRDVYSETGKNILINRGSRLIGTYASTVAFGVSRVQIIWERLIRPDGIDIRLASPSIDNLGRTGATGDADNHILQNLSTAMMISTLDIALAMYLDKNSSSGSSTTTTVQGGVTTTGGASTTGTVINPTVTTGSTPTNEEDAASEALTKIQDIGKQILAKTMALPPTVTIDQGTSLKVYVKKDLLFPGRSANLTRVVE
jgi:type IV secretion system protein VirB10